MKKRTNLNKIVKCIEDKFLVLALVGTILSPVAAEYILSKKDNLNPKDFENAPIINYYNKGGRIWDEYMAENIPHNSTNWKAYNDEMKKLNPKGYNGKIKVYDLDGNGTVGKQLQ